jgi:aspartyl protease family protein
MKSARIRLFVLLALLVAPLQAADIIVLGLFTDMAILRVDGKQYKLRSGESTPEGIRLISATSDEAVLEVDGKRETFPLGSHVTLSSTPGTKSDADQSADEVRIYPSDGMYFTAGSINGQPVHFLVDTGATWVSMGEPVARRLGIDFRYKGDIGYANTANGTVKIYRVNLDKVKVGNIELHNVTGAVLEGKTSGEVLLGQSFLNRTKMKRDGRMMLLQKKW